MAIKSEDRVINDNPVYVRQWPASVALENLGLALKVFGNSLPSLVEGDFILRDILTMLASGGTETVPLIKKFIASARIDGQEVKEEKFNAMFSGELLQVFKVLSFVCEVQFKDFFEQGLALTDQDLPQVQKTEKETR